MEQFSVNCDLSHDQLTNFFFQIKFETVFTGESMLTKINSELVKVPVKPEKLKMFHNPPSTT